MIKNRVLFIALTLFMIGDVKLVFAETDLTIEQKKQKALEFSQTVTDQAAAARAAAPPAAKPWTLSIAGNYGHNDNTSYDSRRKGDVFHQETITGTLEYDHPRLNGLFGEGKVGILANVDDLNYSKQNGSDYRNLKINPYVTTNLTKTLSLRSEYAFKNYWYIHDNSLSYHGHEIKVSLSESRVSKQIHKIYGSTEYDDYSRRKQLSASNSSLSDARGDWKNEFGYEFIYLASNTMILGIGGAYQANDSNDLFHDLNDYKGGKITGFVYKAFNDKLSWVGAAGYDYKNYEEKLLPTNLGNERDEFVYVVHYLFYKLTPSTQLSLSYFFDQNYSNDPLLDFTGHTVTGGITVKI